MAGLEQAAPDHGRDDGVFVQRRHGLGQHVPAVAQHGDAVGQLHHLVDAVRDVDDRDAVGGELADDREQPPAFARRQRRGRLVHDQDASLDRQRLGDLDELLLADPERSDAGIRVELDAEPVEQRPCPRWRAAIDDQPGDQRLAAEKDVVRDAELGDEVELLVDDGDAGGLGIADAGEGTGAPPTAISPA